MVHKAIAASHRLHMRQLAAHHKRAGAMLVRLMHKIRNDKKNYKNGKAPKRSSGTRKPKKAAGMTMRGSGMFDFVHRGWKKVKGWFHQGKKHLTKKAKEAGQHIKKELMNEAKTALRKGATYALTKSSDVISGKSSIKDAAKGAVSGAKAYAKGRVKHHKDAFTKSAKEHVAKYKQMALDKVEEAKRRLAED